MNQTVPRECPKCRALREVQVGIYHVTLVCNACLREAEKATPGKPKGAKP